MKLPRLFGLLVLNLILIGIIFAIAPQQAPVTLYKLSLVTLAALVGYWIDRTLFPYARPSQFIQTHFYNQAEKEKQPLTTPVICDEVVFNFCQIRRAIIIGCAMLAMGLGA